MDISAGLIAKTLGALAAASAVGGGTWWMLEGEDEVKSNKITKYDKALIEYLHHGGKIQFAVTNGSNKLDNFPSFNGTNSQTIAVTIKIKVSDNDGNVDSEGKLKENDKDGARKESKKEHLKEVNGGNTDWTWICEMNFTRNNNSNDVNDLNEEQKNKVFKSPKDGLFGKLKDESADKKIKKEFVRECGHARGVDKNKEINEKPTNTEIKNSDEKKINFELVKGGDAKIGTDVNKLFFSNPRDFKRWFSEGQTQKPAQAASA